MDTLTPTKVVVTYSLDLTRPPYFEDMFIITKDDDIDVYSTYKSFMSLGHTDLEARQLVAECTQCYADWHAGKWYYVNLSATAYGVTEANPTRVTEMRTITDKQMDLYSYSANLLNIAASTTIVNDLLAMLFLRGYNAWNLPVERIYTYPPGSYNPSRPEPIPPLPLIC